MFASGAIIYSYVGGNPVNLTDPLGLHPWWDNPGARNPIGSIIDWILPPYKTEPIPADPASADPSSNPQASSKDKATQGCKFIREVYYGGQCKTCVYSCPGYGAPVTFGQAVGKACPGITPQGLVDTSQLDPKCSGGKDENCPK